MAIWLSLASIINTTGQSYNTNKSLTSLSEETNWIAKWYHDKKSAFSFSFDDGFISQYENVGPILNQFNFNGTFYILPPYLTEDPNDRIWRYGTWPMFIEMSFDGHEIGSHTMNHLHLPELTIGDINQEGTLLYELYQSQDSINQRLPHQKCITLAYPFAEHNDLVDSIASLFYESARADGLNPNGSSVEDSLWHQLNAIEVYFTGPRTSVSDDMEELQFMKDWIDSSISNNTWGIMLAHEVVPQDSLAGLISAGAYEPISNEWFTLLCEWISAKSIADEVWIETVANVTRYIKERDNAIQSILTWDEQSIQLSIDDELDDTIYDFPLTIFVKVPDSWELALLNQEGSLDTLEVFERDSDYVVMADVIPNGSLITINKLNPSSVDSGYTLVSNFKLHQNYPNPFNPTTTIRYSIAEQGNVKLIVYDILGNKIKELVNEVKSSGEYSVSFDGGNLSSGVYFYTLFSDSRTESRKMVLTK